MAAFLARHPPIPLCEFFCQPRGRLQGLGHQLAPWIRIDYGWNESELQYPRPRSGPFKYIRSSEDEGFLEVDNIKRYSSDCLLFLLTKKGKPRVHRPPPHKDETGRFYSAQCVHYGIKSRSSKELAKKALSAYAKANDGKFVVPPEVAKVTAELESEYKSKKAEYDAKMHAIKTRKKSAEEVSRKKRKREEGRLLNTIAKRSKKDTATVIPKNLRGGGAYTVAALAISEGWDISQSLRLRLYQSQSSYHVIKCHLRGRDTGTGESSFGLDNVIEFQFLDEKTFRGSMHWDTVGRFDIAGELDEHSQMKG